MYAQKQAKDNDAAKSQLSHEAIAYLDSLKEANKAIHEKKSGLGKAVSAKKPSGERKESISDASELKVPERKSSQWDEKPHRRASISEVVSDIWERKRTLSKGDTTLSEMNIREADELPVISSESDEHFTSDTTERRDKDKPEVLVPTSSKTEQQQQRRKPSYSDGSSLIPYAKDAQKAARKKSVAETSAATVDELATSHPAPGTIGRKSTTGLSLQHSRAIQKSIEKSIFGASPRQNVISDTQKRTKSRSDSRKLSTQSTASSAAKDLEHLRMLDSSQNEQEQKSLLKRSLFRKTTGVLSGSSTPSALNSAESVTEDIVEVAVPKGAASSYSFDSFEGSSSTRTVVSSPSERPEHARNISDLSNRKTEIKKGPESTAASVSGSRSSRGSSLGSSFPAPVVKQPANLAVSGMKGKVVRKSESESATSSSSTSSNISSETSTLNSKKSKTSYELEICDSRSSKVKRKHSTARRSAEMTQKLKSYEKNNRKSSRDHKSGARKSQRPLKPQQLGDHTELRIGSSPRPRSRRSSQKSSHHSYEMSRSSRSVSDLSSLASSEVSAMSLVEEPDSTRTQDMTRKSHLVYENLLTDFERVFGKFIENSRKTRQDIKETSNAAAQTVAVRKDSELPPTFTPLLLRDIEENMKTMNEKEAYSLIIHTHVDLIKKQAEREKRALEEWDSAVRDLEERCKVVTFDRLKKVLHSNDYFDIM